MVISINDGRVGTEIDAGSWPTESRYGKFIVKSSDGSWAIGGYGELEYILTLSGSSLTVKKAPGASYDTFAGNYKQTSTSPLRDK